MIIGKNWGKEIISGREDIPQGTENSIPLPKTRKAFGEKVSLVLPDSIKNSDSYMNYFLDWGFYKTFEDFFKTLQGDDISDNLGKISLFLGDLNYLIRGEIFIEPFTDEEKQQIIDFMKKYLDEISNYQYLQEIIKIGKNEAPNFLKQVFIQTEKKLSDLIKIKL